MQKHRSFIKLKESLPNTPRKLAASTTSEAAKLVQNYSITPSPENVKKKKKVKMADALLSDVKTVADVK